MCAQCRYIRSQPYAWHSPHISLLLAPGLMVTIRLGQATMPGSPDVTHLEADSVPPGHQESFGQMTHLLGLALVFRYQPGAQPEVDAGE